MAAAPKMTREEEFLIKQDKFRRYAFMIINEMVAMASKQERPARPSKLVDEVIHSIFCLGQINKPKYTLKGILVFDDMINGLKEDYPEPFKSFSSQLPKRSPFSCVLDMIVNLKGQDKENEIKKELQELIQRLKDKERTALKGDGGTTLNKDGGTALISSTICVSQKNAAGDSVRYYGASMSTSGPVPGQIVVAASCLNKWDSYVADAVMTYYSKEKKKQKKPYFDGTIKLPKQVRCQAFSLSDGTIKLPKQARCQAFSLSDGTPMAPCRSCGNMFDLTTSETREWPYGNCAEPESLSNLLNNEKEMREQVKQPSDTCTDANRERAVQDVEKLLKEYLRMQEFQWDNRYYTPQGN